MSNVISVRSYLEAAGVILGLKNSISLESVRRPIACAMPLADATRAGKAAATPAGKAAAP